MDKENDIPQKRPLNISNYQTPERQKERLKISKQDQLISVVEEAIVQNPGCDLINIILSDPLLKQFNSSLQKEAEQQKRSKLLESFPLRYKNLVNTQSMYKQTQKQLKEVQKEAKEMVQIYLKEKESMEDQIVFLKKQLDKKDNLIINLKEEQQKNKEEHVNQTQKKWEQREKEVQGKLNDFERKLIKVKCQKDNMVEYLQELKEQSEVLKKENHRIIQLLTQKQEQLNNVQRKICESQKSYSVSKQNFMSQIAQTELQCSEKVQKINKDLNQFVLLSEGLKARLKECEEEIFNLMKEKQQEENQHFDQVQTLREQMLETVRSKNQLEEQLETLNELCKDKTEELSKEIQNLKKIMQNRELQIQVNKQNHQNEIINMKQIYSNMQAAKDQTIGFLQDKVVKSDLKIAERQEEIMSLQAQISNLEKRLQTNTLQKEQTLQKCRQLALSQKKTENKNKDIEKMVKQVKQQLNRFSEIIEEKQAKIQQYRKDILSLRSQINELILQKEQIKQQVAKINETNSDETVKKDLIEVEIQKYRTKEAFLNSELKKYQSLFLVEKKEQDTQCQLLDGSNEQNEIQLQLLKKQLQKTKQKYDNVLEELKTYKTDFAAQKEENQGHIEQLQTQLLTLRQKINSSMVDSCQIEKIVGSQLSELKNFYEGKIAEENVKYKDVISMLKSQMSDLYKQIDLKKSLEEQMYKEIMQFSSSKKQ